MVKMRYDKRISHLIQSAEQTEAICPARNADDDEGILSKKTIFEKGGCGHLNTKD